MNYSITNNGTKANLAISFEGIDLNDAVKLIEFAKTIGSNTSDLDYELLKIMKGGSLLMAVKLYKESTGSGLKESKDYCDNLRLKHNIE